MTSDIGLLKKSKIKSKKPFKKKRKQKAKCPKKFELHQSDLGYDQETFERVTRQRTRVISKINKFEIAFYKRLKTEQIPAYVMYPLLINDKTYIVDFFLPLQNLVIEIDGLIHQTPEMIKKDEKRDRAITEHGYSLMRIPNSDIMSDYVINNIILQEKFCG